MKDTANKQAKTAGIVVLVIAIIFVGLIVFLYIHNKNTNSSSNSSSSTQVATSVAPASDLTAAQIQAAQTEFASGWTDSQKIALAKALSAKNVLLYGASWCPNCKNQEAALGANALQFIKYVECGTTNDEQTSGQTKVCQDAGIQGYPTWVYNGQQKQGSQTLDDLAAWIGFTK